MRDIPRFRLVWVTVPAATSVGASIFFPDIPELRERKIIAVEAYDLGMLAATPDLVAVVTQAEAPAVTIVLKDDNDQRLQDFPITTLMPTYNAGIYKQVDPFVVNWSASFVRINATVTGPCSIPLGVFYL